MARILVIDDEPLARYTIREALENSGHHVAEAENGREGLQLFALQPFDVIVTDILMPEMDGVQTIQELRLLSRVAKVVAITGGGTLRSEGRLDLATKTGADRVLTKPVSDEDLISCVDACLA